MKTNEVREQTKQLIERSQSFKPKFTPQTGEGDGEPLRLSIIPVSTQKTPYKPWKQYQKTQAPYQEWREHYCSGGYVGIICGEVSDHLEAIDIDLKNDPQKTIWEEYKKLIPEDLFQKLLIQTTPNDGYHIIYRCPGTEIDKNQKLAHSEEGEVILETRGEGGYFCTHLRDYQAFQGRFHLAQFQIQIPEITPEERETLLDLARSLDRTPRKSGSIFQYGDPAIEKFNLDFDLIPLMEEHDWSVYDEDQEKVRLTRPGSNAPYSGYYLLKDRIFICFSTSTPFKPQQAYNHFQVLKILKGENSYHKTVRLLPGYGYELEKKSTPKISPDEIAEHLNAMGVRHDLFRQDLIYKGEIIDEVTYNTLYLELCKDINKDIPRSKFEAVIKSYYIDQYHPIREFISQNSDRNPHGSFEKWVECLTFMNRDLDPLVVVHFFRKWYVGMIAQAMNGPFPNEFFLSLLSQKQGVGKTTLLRNYLLPEELRDYQAEHALTFTDDFKVLMGQVLLLIDDELDGRSFEQSQSFKNILSTVVNTTRRKYDRRISSIRRRASFAGSGNLLKVVRERGERRIIPLEVKAIDREKLNQLNLTDMFIEAYNLFREGFEYSFQPGDKALLDQMYREHYQESDLDLIIEDMMEHPGEDQDVFYITNLDLVNTLAPLYPNSTRRINVTFVGKKMAEHGFDSKRIGKKKTTTYLIGGESRIIEMLGEDCQSWRLLSDMSNRSENITKK